MDSIGFMLIIDGVNLMSQFESEIDAEQALLKAMEGLSKKDCKDDLNNGKDRKAG